MAKQISKIVITGGPCGGKSTALSWIQNNFTKLGYTVLFVSEAATELIEGGIAPWTCNSVDDFQRCIMKMQIEKEKIFVRAAEDMPGDKVLIVCDRGLLDNRVYMDDALFNSILKNLGKTEVTARDDYDAVFHLVTAAKGAVEFYTLANNEARTETPEQAAALDDKLIAAWTGHPHLRVIENTNDFEDKMQRLVTEITAFLGAPEPFEIEHKFLIDMPDIKALEAMDNCSKVDIIQTYLKTNDPDHEIRIRQRGANGSYIYTKTEKITVNGLKRVEFEERLTAEEYLHLLMDADTNLKQIRKNRYCLAHGSCYYEIDIYPFWQDKAILEIELNDEDEEVIIPDFIHVIKEVTDDPEYKNHILAAKY